MWLQMQLQVWLQLWLKRGGSDFVFISCEGLQQRIGRRPWREQSLGGVAERDHGFPQVGRAGLTGRGLGRESVLST